MTNAQLIERSRRMVVARWLLAFGVVPLAIAFGSTVGGWIPDSIQVLFGGVIGLGAVAAAVMYAVSPGANRAIVTRLSVPEIRDVIRKFGKPTGLLHYRAYCDLLCACLPKIESRSDLSEPEWKIVAAMIGMTHPRLERIAAKTLLRFKVVEAASWIVTEEDTVLGSRVVSRDTKYKLHHLPKSETASLPPFAVAEGNALTLEECLLFGRFEAQGLLAIAGGVVAMLISIALSVAGTGSTLVSLMLLMGAMVLGLRGARGAQLFPKADPAEPTTLPALMDAAWSARGWWQTKVGRGAFIFALRATEDFSAMTSEHFERLLAYVSTGPKYGREHVLFALLNHAPESLLPAVHEESSRWLASKHRRAPARIQELTEIRLGVMRRLGSQPTPTRAIQEVP